MTDLPNLPEEDDGGILLPILVVLLIVDGLVTAALIAYLIMFGGMIRPAADPSGSTSQAQTSQTQGSGGTTASNPNRSTQPDQGTASGSGNGGNGFDTETFDRPDWPEGKLLGSKESDKYHSTNCATGAARIRPENEVWFDSVAEAEAANYSPCGICYK